MGAFHRKRGKRLPSSTAHSTLDDGTGRFTASALGGCSSCAARSFLDALDVVDDERRPTLIRADLGMSTSSLQWIVSAYVLGYGCFLFDRRGLASTAAGYAPFLPIGLD